MSNQDVSHVVAGIYELDTTEDINRVFDAANDRIKQIRKRNAAINASTITVGQQVRLKELSPKFLNGNVVEVTSVNGTQIGVKPIEGATGFKASQRLASGGRVPAACVEPA